MRMVDFIKGLLDSILSGSLERMRIINAMNNSFKEAYYSGELERLCKTSITYNVFTNSCYSMLCKQ